MSHFQFESVITDLVKMDGPIQRGPLMRWQRKALESGQKSTTPGRSRSSSVTRTPGRELQNTPGKSASAKQTPVKTPGKSRSRSKTPSKTPGKSEDRFIPNRAATDVELSHFALLTVSGADSAEGNENYQQQLDQAMFNGQKPQESKILAYRNKMPANKDGHVNNLKVLYSSHQGSASHSTGTRHISTKPDRILDAPDMIDDYYLNLLDWSVNNYLAVALGTAVYLWNASNGSIVQLMELDGVDYVSSINWIPEGSILAVGTSNGIVQLWDVGHQKLMRSMSGHAARIGTLSWNSHILSSGSRSGSIHHHDVRIAQHHVASLLAHSQEVCGLKWSPDSRYLASGGNDNKINIWDPSLGMDVTPLHTLTHHQAAVKALAWCPWNSQLLATGGGTADRDIRFWNVQNGSCQSTVNTNSQVCAILWNKDYKEFISGHGFSQHQLTIWKYPAMNKVVDLTGHTARVLCMTMSPDGTTVASAAADETIRLWNCFAVDKSQKSIQKSKETPTMSILHKGIR